MYFKGSFATGSFHELLKAFLFNSACLCFVLCGTKHKPIRSLEYNDRAGSPQRVEHRPRHVRERRHHGLIQCKIVTTLRGVVGTHFPSDQ